MARNFVGIDFGSYDVKLALVSVGLRGAQIVEHVRVPAPEADASAMGAALELAVAVLRERGWLHHPLGVVLPAGSGSYRLLEFPFADPKRIAQTLPFEIEGKFAMPLDELVYDHLDVATADKRGVALVAGVRRELVDHVAQRFKAAGADLRVITLGPLALAQLQPLPSRAGTKVPQAAFQAGVLVVDIGHRYCEVVAVGEKGVVGARSFRFGGSSIDRAVRKAVGGELGDDALVALKSDAAQLDLAQPEATPVSAAVAKALELLIKEIGRTAQYLHTEASCEITEIRLTGASAALAGFEGWMGEQLALPVARLRPEDFRSKWTGRVEEWGAFGAALAAARRPVMQLLQGQGGGAGDISWISERLPTLAYLGVVVLAALAIDTVVQVRAEERQRDAYAAELASVSQQVFGGPVGSIDQVRELLAVAGEGGGQSPLPQRGAADVLAMLTKVAMPDGRDTLIKGSDSTESSGGSSTSTGAGSTADDASSTSASGATSSGSEIGGLQPVAADAGIVDDDGLSFSNVDIRERKLSLNVAALRASARDRLKRKLESIPCVKLVSAGKTRDREQYKEFGFEIEHDCYNEPGVVIEP